MIGRQECSIYRLVVDLMEESTVIYLGIIGKQLIYLLHIELYIVDDSIDSGGTMLAVYNIIKAEAQLGAIIKTASITVTTENPLIQPDIVLFKYVLCRFPWAFDFRS